MPAINVIVRPEQPENRFGRYVGEMLKSEGISDFEITDVDAAGWPNLDSGLVVLTRCRLRRAEIAQLLDYVHRGGVLVALQAPWRLCEPLGIAPKYQAILDAYLLPDATHPAAHGLPSESIQCHWPVESFDVSGADPPVSVLAHACARGTAAPLRPAVVSARIGSGAMVLFFYDPPASVARIRFGNPDLAGISTTSMPRDSRSSDLFTGHFDATRGHLPQADLHCAFLANVLTVYSPQPLPRLWYYPRAEQRSVLAMRSDGDHSTPEQFDRLRAAVEQRGGRDTFYLMRATKLPDADVRRFTERGHSFSIHSNPHASGEDPYFHMGAILADDMEAFHRRYGRRPRTTQIHSAFWRGHMDLIPTYHRLGVLLAVTVGAFREWFGMYLAGSCRPMKFVEDTGRIHDVFQMPYTLFDDASIQERLTHHAPEEVARAARILDDCVGVHFSPIGFQSHPVSFATYAEPYICGVMDAAQARGVPVASMEDWYAFTQARYDALLQARDVSDGEVVCELTPAASGQPLVAMLPLQPKQQCHSATVNGRPAQVHPISAFGIPYAAVSVDEVDRESVQVAFRTGRSRT